MELNSVSDVKLVARALTSGWLDGFEERRKKAVHDLFDVVENCEDPDMKVKAFTALVRADAADLKRQEVVLKKQEADDAKRLRLLELVKQLPAGILAKIAARDPEFADSGREGISAHPDGEKASI
jgi:hypothetical protein